MKVVIWVAFLGFFCQCSCFNPKTIEDVIVVSKQVIFGLSKVWDIVKNQLDGNTPVPLVEETERKLLRKMETISRGMDDLSLKVDSLGENTIASLLHTVPERMRLELRLNDLYDYITRIDVIYSRMQDYVQSTQKYEVLTLEDFARSIISHDGSSVVNLMERIHAFLVPHGEGLVQSGILNLLVKTLNQDINEMICGNAQSPQQILYSLYNSIALTELKGYSMVQFSYMLLKLYDKGNFTKEVAKSRMNFEERGDRAVEVVKGALRQASRQYWKCDPRKHIKGETYEQITNLLQGFIINEVDMNSDGTCKRSCAAYPYAETHGCFQNLFCGQQRPCNGKVLDCRFVDSDMSVCLSDPKSGRRYDFIEYENGIVYGKSESCINKLTKVDSWWRWLFWHCSYCMCICDAQGSSSDRYLNLRPVMSDIEDNKVITGLRFVKKHRIIHLQIQQGILGPYGAIDSNSTSWKDVENYSLFDASVFSGSDYHIFTWDKRIIHLDDIEADKNQVLTGVKFEPTGTSIRFRIHTTSFDFQTGKLMREENTWKGNKQRNHNDRIIMNEPDIPTRTLTSSIPMSNSNDFIEFTHTDFKKDAAQTTIPFIDAQPVSMIKPVALSGAGIYYKGKKHFSGFIAPKLITYDYSEHLKPNFKTPMEEIDVNDIAV